MVLALLISFMAASMPPEWSRCQWLRWMRDMLCRGGFRRFALAVKIEAVGPVSKRRVWGMLFVDVPVWGLGVRRWVLWVG